MLERPPLALESPLNPKTNTPATSRQLRIITIRPFSTPKRMMKGKDKNETKPTGSTPDRVEVSNSPISSWE